MNNQKELEEKYLNAKIAYYTGESIMSDAEFDIIENLLKSMGSSVVNQVGAKVKDFDFPQPTRMRSLAKIQTEKTEDGSINYMDSEFYDWFNKKSDLISTKFIDNKRTKLISSPKFDGNAINIIYRKNKLSSILTRGDGTHGKNITDRLKNYVDEILETDQVYDLFEIRAEIVLAKSIFNEKYSKEFANPRNYVAGLLSSDEWDEEKISELTIIPVHFLANSEQVSPDILKNGQYQHTWFKYFDVYEYIDEIKYYEKLREETDYPLDGVVISFDYPFRKELGENDHDPEWSIAIKFVPEEVITNVTGIEWTVSKTGEMIPVVLLEPKFLDGSTVKRVTGYNWGYIKKNKIGKGTVISLAKAGDIIPEIQSVITPGFVEQPSICPHCGNFLDVDDIHLHCNNQFCSGRIAKQLSYQVKILGIKGIGEKMIEPFAEDFSNLIEVIHFIKTKGDTEDIIRYGIKFESKTHKNILKIFNNIKEIEFYKLFMLSGFEGVGNKLSKQLEKEYFGLDYDYSHLEKDLVTKMRSEEVKKIIDKYVEILNKVDIKVKEPKREEQNSNKVGIVLTGSPKSFGFKTKKEFLEQHPNFYETKFTDPNCKYLITDDLNSTSSKMKTAQKKGIEVKLYGEL